MTYTGNGEHHFQVADYFSPEVLLRNRVISNASHMDCVTLEGMVEKLQRKGYEIRGVSDGIVGVSRLIATQTHYSFDKYGFLVEHPRIADEPIIVLQSQETRRHYTLVGHVRTQRNHDLGNEYMRAFLIRARHHGTTQKGSLNYEAWARSHGDKLAKDLSGVRSTPKLI